MFPEHKVLEEHFLTAGCLLDKYFLGVVLKQAQVSIKEPVFLPNNIVVTSQGPCMWLWEGMMGTRAGADSCLRERLREGQER